MSDPVNIALRRQARLVKASLERAETALKEQGSLSSLSNDWNEIMTSMGEFGDSNLAKRISLISPSASADSYLRAIGMARREIKAWLKTDFADVVGAASRCAIFTKTGGTEQHYPNLSKGAQVAAKDMNANLAIAGEDLNDFVAKHGSIVVDEAEPDDTVEEVKKLDDLNDVFIDNLALSAKSGYSVIPNGMFNYTVTSVITCEPYGADYLLYAAWRS